MTRFVILILDVDGGLGPLNNGSIILGCLSSRLQGDALRGQEFLRDTAGKAKVDSRYPAIQYLRDELSEAEFLERAANTDEQVIAHCYIGLNRLAAGHLDESRIHFAWVRDHAKALSVERVIARSELQRLNQIAEEP